MSSFIDVFIWATLAIAPLVPILYVFTLSVADALISAIKNWNE